MTVTTKPPSFPFEQYLSHSSLVHLPDYDYEWNIIILKMILVTILFIVVIPSFLKRIFAKKKNDKSNSSTSTSTKTTNVSALTNRNTKKESRRKESKRCTNDNKNEINTNTTTKDNMNKEEEEIYVPSLLLIILNTIYLCILLFLIATSPNNIRTSRHVYQAPLLTKAECQSIIDMGHRAAERNTIHTQNELKTIPTFLYDNDDNANNLKKTTLEKILSQPSGWKKDRHKSYATTDLNVVIDFTKEDRLVLSKLLHARLSPILSKVYGITPDSIRANDMFLVRYDGDFGQQALAGHTDSSHVSFNILLNNDFEGGGTRYHHRIKGTYYDAKPNVGDVLINNAMVQHEGLATTKGTRYILVGFMNVDRVDPWTGVPTNVPLHSTYLSFQWLTVSCKSQLYTVDSDNRNTHLSRSQEIEVFAIAATLAAVIGDYYAPHGLINLVPYEKKNDYLKALDEYYDEFGEYLDKAKWFQGQQIEVNFIGRLIEEWDERINNPEKFEEL